MSDSSLVVTIFIRSYSYNKKRAITRTFNKLARRAKPEVRYQAEVDICLIIDAVKPSRVYSSASKSNLPNAC